MESTMIKKVTKHLLRALEIYSLLQLDYDNLLLSVASISELEFSTLDLLSLHVKIFLMFSCSFTGKTKIFSV